MTPDDIAAERGLAPEAAPAASHGPAWRRLWPLAVLAAVAALAYLFGLHRWLSFESLAAHRSARSRSRAAG